MALLENNVSLQKLVLQVLCFAFLLPFAIWFSFFNAFYNWDLLAYAAIVFKYDGAGTHEIHKLVYSWANVQLPQEAKDIVLSGEQYNIQCAEQPDFFLAQLDFYKVKPLFTGMVFLFYKIGIPLKISLQIPSFLSFLFIGNILLRWLNRETVAWLAIFGSILFTVAFCSQVASLSTPDALAALLVLCFFYSFFYNKHWAIQVLLLVLLILTRIDFAILAACFLFFVGMPYWQKRNIPVGFAVGTFLLVALLGLLIPVFFGNDLLWFLHYSFTNSFVNYFKQLAIGLRQILTTKLLLIAGLLLFSLPIVSSKWRVILLTIVLSIGLRGLLFPIMQDRFFIGYYLVAVVYIVCHAYANKKLVNS